MKTNNIYTEAAKWYESLGKSVSAADTEAGQQMIRDYLVENSKRYDNSHREKDTVRIGKVSNKVRRVTLSFTNPAIELKRVKSIAGKKVILPFDSTNRED